MADHYPPATEDYPTTERSRVRRSPRPAATPAPKSTPFWMPLLSVTSAMSSMVRRM